MSRCAAFQYLVVLVAPLIHHQCAEAAFPDEEEDRSRVLLTYDLSTDQCRNVTPNLHTETQQAANKACAQAFEALHRLGVNSCKGWRQPECRLIEGVAHPQCSCLISTIDNSDIKSNEGTGFRYCAWRLFSEGIFAGQKPVLSASFQRRNQQFHDEAVEKAHQKRIESESSRAGSKRGSKRRRGNRVGPYECQFCGRSYDWPESLAAHKKTHIREAKCESCGLSFSTEFNFKRHNKKTHKEIYKEQKETDELVRMIEKPFECEICQARYAVLTTYNQHMAIHRGETTCDLCNRVFPRRTMLNTHKKHEHS